jgi:co-chaperonin GroES (HSP10)
MAHVFAQKIQFQDVSLQTTKNWSKKSQTEAMLRLDYQKASAKVQIYALGKVSSEDASKKMVEIFQSEKINPSLFSKAKQEKKKIGKQEVLLFEWEDILSLDSQNSTLITSYQLYLFEKKGNKYYILTMEYFLKEKGNSIKTEMNKLIATLK